MFDVLITKVNEDTEYIRKVIEINYQPGIAIFITENNAFGMPIDKIKVWKCFPIDFLLK